MSLQKGTEVRVDSDVEWPTTTAPCSRWFTTGSGFFSTEEGSKGYHWIELRNYKGAVIDEIVSAEDLESLNMQDWDSYYNTIDAPHKSLSEEVVDWERTLWERTPPGNRLAKEVAEWEHTLLENVSDKGN